MERDELISVISMRTDIPMDEVEEVLDEEDLIYLEEARCKKKKRTIIMLSSILLFMAGMIVALLLLDKNEKISLADYREKCKAMCKSKCKECAE